MWGVEKREIRLPTVKPKWRNLFRRTKAAARRAGINSTKRDSQSFAFFTKLPA